ncbi:MAG: BLUF domain-containing protein [Burkholderiaceae bacterium]
MLVRLLYASRTENKISAADADSIIRIARDYNPSHGITGILCYTGNLYLQVLEGGRTEVNELYARIVGDERHKDMTLLDYEEIVERRFAAWSMGRVNLGKQNPSLLLKYAERPALDPFALSGKAALALLDELLSTAAVITRSDVAQS